MQLLHPLSIPRFFFSFVPCAFAAERADTREGKSNRTAIRERSGAEKTRRKRRGTECDKKKTTATAAAVVFGVLR